jgi:hypothetical protein
MRKTMVVASLSLASCVASACSPKSFDPANDAALAEFLVVGWVTGDRHPSFEKQVLAGKENPQASSMWERHLRIAVAETLRGTTADIIEVLAPCGAPFPRAYERVLVTKGADGFTRGFLRERTRTEGARRTE